ncbi:hypothetical protein PF010_g32912, partial [Phytophthora fragariae]
HATCHIQHERVHVHVLLTPVASALFFARKTRT